MQTEKTYQLKNQSRPQLRRVSSAQGTARGSLKRKAAPRTKRQSVPAPVVLLIGSSKRAHAVAEILEDGFFDTVVVTDEVEALLLPNDNVLATVVADTFRGRPLTTVCETIKESDKLGDVPLFFVLSNKGIEQYERKLYLLGCEAIFEYPREKYSIPQLLAKYLRSHKTTSASSALDKGLETAVKERLEAERDVLGKNLKVSVYRGIVSVRGKLDAYWKLRFMERMLASLPRVTGLLTSGVSLDIKKRGDKRLERDIRGLVTLSSELKNTTLDISVLKGAVTIRGSAKDAYELERLEELISQTKGVTNVSLVVVVSEKQARRDNTLAKALNKRLGSVFPSNDLRASVFGGVAVLRGRVNSLAQALEANKAALRVEGVARAVNKIQVVSS